MAFTHQGEAYDSVGDYILDKLAGGVVTPSRHNLLGWNYDPQVASGNSLVGAGVEYLVQVTPIKNGPCSFVHLGLHSLGVTLTAGQCFAGLRDKNGVLLGKTASQDANWAATLYEKKMALVTPAAVEAGEPYYVCFVANGATMPGFARQGTSDLINASCAAGAGRSMYSGGGQTDLPANRTMSALNMTNLVGWWAGIS